MNKISVTLITSLTIVVAAMTGCKKDENKIIVEAAFSLDRAEIYAGESVNFINSSVNANYYQWDFGDGNSSIDENPSHIFSEDGTYVVTLISIGSEDADTATKSIEVLEEDYEVTIFEGAGIEGAPLYAPWIDIRSSFTSDTSYFRQFLPDFGLYYHEVYFPSEGAGFIFYSDTTFMEDSLALGFIFLLQPYEGATENGITIGSSMERVKQRYGDPENEIQDGDMTAYWYDSRGIDFYSLDGSGKVNEIVVYDPEAFAKKSVPAGPATREIIRKRELR